MVVNALSYEYGPKLCLFQYGHKKCVPPKSSQNTAVLSLYPKLGLGLAPCSRGLVKIGVRVSAV